MSDRKFPIRRTTDKTAEVGVNAVASIINDEIGWMFRRNPLESDYGVDGYIDYVTDEGAVTGRYCAVQIKTGKSYLNISDSKFWYTDTHEHLNYFSNLPTPLLMILCDPESKNCYWALLDEGQVQRAEKSWKHPVLETNLLNIDSKVAIGEIINASEASAGWNRAPVELALRTDGKFGYENVVVTYDAWTMSNDVTCVKLNFSEQLEESVDAVIGAVNAVKAFLASVGTRGQYMHALLVVQNSKFEKLSVSCPSAYQQQFDDWFVDFLDNLEWFAEGAQMDGKIFDWVACNTKGTGEWSLFLFDITAFYVPEQFANYSSQ